MIELSQDAPESQGEQEKPQSFEKLSVEQRAELVPKQIIDFKKNEPAFIFSKTNLMQIRRYVLTVKKLPPDITALRTFADFEVLGLSIEDVFVFHENLRMHVASWDGIQESCKRIGNELQLFAEDFLVEGAKFLASVEVSAEQKLEQAKGHTPLPATVTNELKESSDIYLSHILEELKLRRDSIQHVKTLIDTFGKAIAENLQPMGLSLTKAINKRNADHEIAELGQSLDQLDQQIAEAEQRYSGLVGTAFYGLVFGPVGLAITGGIYGAQAEQVRSEKNALIEKREGLTNRRAALLSGLEGFENLQTSTADISFRLVEVMTAVEHLEDVWRLLETYVETSIKKSGEVSTVGTLRRFTAQFGRVMRPWGSILNISKQLSLLFNEALETELEG
nr:alpha-xenorhabdolysin family binary toxin subunit A [uncultured Pseudomonas sp.]